MGKNYFEQRPVLGWGNLSSILPVAIGTCVIMSNIGGVHGIFKNPTMSRLVLREKGGEI